MLVHLSDIVTQENGTLEREIPLSLESVDSGEGCYRVTEQSPLHLVITNTGDKVLELRGEAAVTVQIPCSRCLWTGYSLLRLRESWT